MSEFEYLAVFISIIFGISLTHILAGVIRSVYRGEAVADADAAKHGQIRVIDESGEDYLYPKECFVDANLPEDIRAAVVEAA